MMRVIRPVSVSTDAQLTYSTLAESALAAWSSGNTYAIGEQVQYGHRAYTSLQNSNTGHSPAEVGSTWWIDNGTVNRWAMFDGQVSSESSGSSPLTVTITPGQAITGIALHGLTAASVQVIMRDGPSGTEVYNQTNSLDGYTVSDWYEYLTAPIESLTDTVFVDLPSYAACEIEVSIVGSGTVSCGVLVLGSIYGLGAATYGARAGIVDYSRKTTDTTTGITTFEQRAYSRRLETMLICDGPTLNKVYSLLASLRATPCSWVLVDDATGYESLMVHGWYRDFGVTLSLPSAFHCNLQIEGLT